MARMLIHLIDDDLEDHDIFSMALEETGLDVTLKCYDSASAGISDLKTLKRSQLPDYVFLDLNMPKINGKDCLKDLRENGLLSSLKVIVYSTSSNSYDISESKALGAFDYLVKPVSFKVLVDSLKSLILSVV